MKNLAIKSLKVGGESVDWGMIYRLVVTDEAGNGWRTIKAFDKDEAEKIATSAKLYLFWGLDKHSYPNGFRFRLDCIEYLVIPICKNLIDAELIAHRILSEVATTNQALYDYCQHLAWNPNEKRSMWDWSPELKTLYDDFQRMMDSPFEDEEANHLDNAIIRYTLAVREWRDEGQNRTPRKKVPSMLPYIQNRLAAACAEFTLDVLHRLYIERDK